MLIADREALAWAAGFFDGEGYVALMKKNQHRLPRVIIHQVDRYPLERFQRAVAGLGSVLGPYKHKNPKARQFYQYQAAGPEVQAIVAMLWRWLCPTKRADARRALLGYREYRRGLPPRRRRATPVADDQPLGGNP